MVIQRTNPFLLKETFKTLLKCWIWKSLLYFLFAMMWVYHHWWRQLHFFPFNLRQPIIWNNMYQVFISLWDIFLMLVSRRDRILENYFPGWSFIHYCFMFLLPHRHCEQESSVSEKIGGRDHNINSSRRCAKSCILSQWIYWTLPRI